MAATALDLLGRPPHGVPGYSEWGCCIWQPLGVRGRGLVLLRCGLIGAFICPGVVAHLRAGTSAFRHIKCRRDISFRWPHAAGGHFEGGKHLVVGW